MILWATLPISQSHATEALATTAPNCGHRHGEPFISRLSPRRQKPVSTTWRTFGGWGSSIFLPSTIPLTYFCSSGFITNALPGGVKSVGMPWSTSSPRPGAWRERQTRHYLATRYASFSILTLCLITAKNKGWSKRNSLFLEACHRTDIVGPEVVYDWS